MYKYMYATMYAIIIASNRSIYANMYDTIQAS